MLDAMQHLKCRVFIKLLYFFEITKILKIQSTLGFATMGKVANLGLATRNAVTDLF